MRSNRSIERAKLSPFLETAFSQLLAELPKTRQAYELARRIEARVAERRKQIWTRKSRPSKSRKRSKKELEDRKAWFDAHVLGKTVYRADPDRTEEASRVPSSPVARPSVPVAPVSQAQIAAEVAQRIDREIGRERGEAWAMDD